MHFGLVISVLLHATLIGWAVFTIRSERDLPLPEPEPVAVDLVTPGEVTKLRKGVRTAKQLEAEPKESPQVEVAKKEAPKPTPTASAPPPPPKEEATPEPPKEVAKAEPPKPAEPPPPQEEPKAEPVKPPEKVAALPPAPATPPPVPAAEEQQKLEAKIEEELRRAEEERKVEERRIEEERKAEEQKRLEEQRKLEEERRKAEEEQRKLEEQRKAEEQKRLEEQKQAELKKKQEEEKKRKEAELKKKREEEKKRQEAEAKKRFDAEKISALLNKIPDKGAPPPSQPPTQPTTAKGPVLGAPEGRDQTLTASERAVLAQIIRSCIGPKWNVLGGGAEAQNTVVRVRVSFHPDGRLAAPPQVMNPQSSPFFMAMAESAVRAVQACEPYPLPPAKYEAWRDTVLTLNPRDMF